MLCCAAAVLLRCGLTCCGVLCCAVGEHGSVAQLMWITLFHSPTSLEVGGHQHSRPYKAHCRCNTAPSCNLLHSCTCPSMQQLSSIFYPIHEETVAKGRGEFEMDGLLFMERFLHCEAAALTAAKQAVCWSSCSSLCVFSQKKTKIKGHPEHSAA